MKPDFDIIIVGGLAGMTAAIYAALANMSVLILEKEICGGLAKIN
jgi:thioredoxin reductase (NADPH)